MSMPAHYLVPPSRCSQATKGLVPPSGWRNYIRYVIFLESLGLRYDNLPQRQLDNPQPSENPDRKRRGVPTPHPQTPSHHCGGI